LTKAHGFAGLIASPPLYEFGPDQTKDKLRIMDFCDVKIRCVFWVGVVQQRRLPGDSRALIAQALPVCEETGAVFGLKHCHWLSKP
jgi:hypothetical protein